MNVIKTKAPISIEDLKIYFQDKETFYEIDYTSSELKGDKLLTYLSNIELPCDLYFKTDSEVLELLQDYFHFNHVINIRSLECAAINILFQYKGLIETVNTEFIEENKDIIQRWIKKLDSMTLYNMWMVDSEEFKDFVKSHPENETASVEGVNFVSLLKHDFFYSFYDIIDPENLEYYSIYFDEYMFKGKNLFEYWANESNPMFLLTWGIASGEVESGKYFEALRKDAEDLNVSSST